MKLLLLDPDEYYHQQFREKLSPDFEFVAVKSLEDAKRLTAGFQPDLVVSELLFDDGPAFDMLSELRSARGGVPVIVFSQIANLEDIQETLGRGVSGYFVKGKDTVRDVYQLLLTYNS